MNQSDSGPSTHLFKIFRGRILPPPNKIRHLKFLKKTDGRPHKSHKIWSGNIFLKTRKAASYPFLLVRKRHFLVCHSAFLLIIQNYSIFVNKLLTKHHVNKLLTLTNLGKKHPHHYDLIR